MLTEENPLENDPNKNLKRTLDRGLDKGKSNLNPKLEDLEEVLEIVEDG